MVLGSLPKLFNPFLPFTQRQGCVSTRLPKAHALLLSRYTLLLASGAGAALGAIYYTTRAHITKAVSLVRSPMVLSNHRHVCTFFDGFFFPLRTHQGRNLYYLTPVKRRKVRGSNRARSGSLKRPLPSNPAQLLRRSVPSSLNPGFSFAQAPAHRPPQ